MKKIILLKELQASFFKKDIYESNVENEHKFYQLISLLASQTGGEVNINELATTLRIKGKIVERYLLCINVFI